MSTPTLWHSGPAPGAEDSGVLPGQPHTMVSPDGTTPESPSASAPSAPATPRVSGNASSPGTVAAVNLMPPQLRLRAAVRKARSRAIIAIIIAGVVIVALFGLGLSGRASAESQLAAAQKRAATAEAAKNQYSDVPGVYAAIALAQKELSTAMSQEVQFSGLLTNLGLKVPPRVSVSSATMTVGSAAAGKKSAKGATATGPDLGTVTFVGQAASMPDVAALLDALATMTEYTSVHLDSASSSADASGGSGGAGTVGSVQYAISAQLTEKALSGRFGVPAAPSGSAQPAPSGASQSAPAAGGSHG